MDVAESTDVPAGTETALAVVSALPARRDSSLPDPTEEQVIEACERQQVREVYFRQKLDDRRRQQTSWMYEDSFVLLDQLQDVQSVLFPERPQLAYEDWIGRHTDYRPKEAMALASLAARINEIDRGRVSGKRPMITFAMLPFLERLPEKYLTPVLRGEITCDGHVYSSLPLVRRDDGPSLARFVERLVKQDKLEALSAAGPAPTKDRTALIDKARDAAEKAARHVGIQIQLPRIPGESESEQIDIPDVVAPASVSNNPIRSWTHVMLAGRDRWDEAKKSICDRLHDRSATDEEIEEIHAAYTFMREAGRVLYERLQAYVETGEKK